MRRLLLALISFSLAAVVALPVPAAALPSALTVTPGAVGVLDLAWTASGDVSVASYRIDAEVAGSNVFTGTVAAPATSFQITGLADNTAHDIIVTPVDAGAVDLAPAATGSGTTIPAAPSAASITIGSTTATSIFASWSATGVGVTYQVTIAANDGGAVGGISVGPGSASTSRNFTGLDPDKNYTLTMVATNGSGSDSDTATGTTPIAAPSAAAVTIDATTNSSLSVSWSASGDGVTYEATIAANDGGAIGGGAVGPGSSAASTVFADLDEGKSYTVTVVATNAAGSDTDTATGSTSVVAPSAASVTIDSATSSSISASWSATGAGVTYRATIAANDGGAVGGGAVGPGSAATSTTFTGLDPDEGYTVTVVATNATGSDTDTATGTTPFGTAGAPTGVASTISGSNGSDVTVTWSAPVVTGGGLGNYTVRLSNNQSLTAAPGATSVTFTSVAPGATVTATVQASNGGGGVGGISPDSNEVRTSTVPGQVSNVVAVWAGEGNINSVDVTWSAPTFDGDTAGQVSLTGYSITVSPALAAAITDVAAGQTSVTIGGMEQGTSYVVTIRAKNPIGSSAARSSSAVLVPTTPGTVTDLAVQQSPPFSKGVVLTWALPLEDGGSPITGYSIVVDGRAPLVVGPAITTASFADLPVGEHTFTIRAITAAGLGAVVSSPTFEVKAFAPFDSEEDFVTQIYADFLGRSPDAGGLAYWTARVADDGSNVQVIIEGFMRSPEFAPRRSVARLYFAYFDRQPDKGGFDYWTRQVATGAATLENASQSFAASDEFITKTRIEDPPNSGTFRPLTDGEYIVFVYNAVLARRPDQGGFEFWLARLSDGMTRGTLMTLFSESPENIPLSRASVDVTVTYDGMLQRRADVGGFTFWINRVNSQNTGLTELIRNFYFSVEYAGRVNQ